MRKKNMSQKAASKRGLYIGLNIIKYFRYQYPNFLDYRKYIAVFFEIRLHLS